MTVASETSTAHHATDGTTGPFAFTFTVDAAADLKVVKRDNTTLVEIELTKDAVANGYTVSLSTSVPSAGSITLTDAYAAGGTITIARKPTLLQADTYGVASALSLPNLEGSLDKLCRRFQAIREEADRAIKIQLGSQGSTEIEAWVDETNNQIKFVVAYASGATKTGTVSLT